MPQRRQETKAVPKTTTKPVRTKGKPATPGLPPGIAPLDPGQETLQVGDVVTINGTQPAWNIQQIQGLFATLFNPKTRSMYGKIHMNALRRAHVVDVDTGHATKTGGRTVSWPWWHPDRTCGVLRIKDGEEVTHLFVIVEAGRSMCAIIELEGQQDTTTTTWGARSSCSCIVYRRKHTCIHVDAIEAGIGTLLGS